MESPSLSSRMQLRLSKRRRNQNRQKNDNTCRCVIAFAITLAFAPSIVGAFSESNVFRPSFRIQQNTGSNSPSLFNSAASSSMSDDEIDTTVASFDKAVRNRYACTRYSRHDGIYGFENEKVASPANPRVLELAIEALELSTRAPTGFNAQPYKLLLVESVDAKEALSKYCIGRNRDRVLDSDCTVLFLADRQAMSSWKDYKMLLLESSERNRSKSKLAWLKLRALVALFSNGIPLPKIIAGPISFGLRFAMRVVSWFARGWLVVPTLSSPECWSQKNTMLVAMAYMLGCSARGLETTPMEGYLSWGVRQSLKIPRRYTIPLMVATGRAYSKSDSTTKDGEDDAGTSHGASPDKATPRFPIDAIVYENGFPWANASIETILFIGKLSRQLFLEGSIFQFSASTMASDVHFITDFTRIESFIHIRWNSTTSGAYW